MAKYRRLPKNSKVLEKELKAGPAEGIHVFYAILFSIVYFILTKYLGFILTTMLAIWTFSILLRFPNKLLVFIVGLLLPIVLHLGFVTLLKINLPAGIPESLLPF